MRQQYHQLQTRHKLWACRLAPNRQTRLRRRGAGYPLRAAHLTEGERLSAGRPASRGRSSESTGRATAVVTSTGSPSDASPTWAAAPVGRSPTTSWPASPAAVGRPTTRPAPGAHISSWAGRCRGRCARGRTSSPPPPGRRALAGRCGRLTLGSAPRPPIVRANPPARCTRHNEPPVTLRRWRGFCRVWGVAAEQLTAVNPQAPRLRPRHMPSAVYQQQTHDVAPAHSHLPRPPK